MAHAVSSIDVSPVIEEQISPLINADERIAVMVG
jgi:hypothetical protein